MHEPSKAGPSENYSPSDAFDTLPTLGRSFDFRRQRCGSSPNHIDQSKFKQHHIRTDRHPHGDGSECGFGPCNGIERHLLHAALQRRNSNRCANVDDNLHRRSHELKRKRERADHDHGERIQWRRIKSRCFDHREFHKHNRRAVGHADGDGEQVRVGQGDWIEWHLLLAAV